MKIKLANIEFEEKEVEKYYNEDKIFLVKYNTIYLIEYSKNIGFSARIVYKQYYKAPLPYTKKGRFIITTSKHVNNLIGKEIFY